MVTGILHNSLPFGGWIRNALKTFCIRTAVMGKLHRGMLAATFKLHAGLRKSFVFLNTYRLYAVRIVRLFLWQRYEQNHAE